MDTPATSRPRWTSQTRLRARLARSSEAVNRSSSMAAKTAIQHYPDLAGHFRSDGDSIVIPLLYQGTSTGAIYLNFAGRSTYGPEDREFLRSIGAQCGSALERSILIERTNVMAAEEQARAAELGTVLEAIGDGVLVGDAAGRVILANKAVERLLGTMPKNMGDLPERVDDAPSQPGAGNGYLARSPIRYRGWLEVVRFPVVAAATSSDVILIRDVTRLVEADMQRDAFLGVLSHELRTPVTSILVAVDLLRRGDGTARGRRLELLSDIDAESARLRNIVEDLLVLTRSERGALDVTGEPVLVHRLVRRCPGPGSRGVTGDRDRPRRRRRPAARWKPSRRTSSRSSETWYRTPSSTDWPEESRSKSRFGLVVKRSRRGSSTGASGLARARPIASSRSSTGTPRPYEARPAPASACTSAGYSPKRWAARRGLDRVREAAPNSASPCRFPARTSGRRGASSIEARSGVGSGSVRPL